MDRIADAASPAAGTLLTLNAGSSSLKFALFAVGASPERRVGGSVSGIGKELATLRVRSGEPAEPQEEQLRADNHSTALEHVWQWLGRRGVRETLVAVGHRLVHGGPEFFEPERVTPALLDQLRKLEGFAPHHLPPEIAVIDALRTHAPQLPQVVCFDTEFHEHLPEPSRVLPLPREFRRHGVRRYGFHGLSYAFLMQELGKLEPRVAAHGRVILAHLGNGASLAAVREGRCVDTTMGLTPAGGIPMSTRAGDIDPGALTFLAQTEGLTAERLHHMVNFEAGLLAISGTTGDLRELLARSAADARATEAVVYFCYHVKKAIGALAAAIGGCDTLVFSGGVGENAAEIRARACDGLSFLGLHLDPAANRAGASVISTEASAVTVRVIPTDEEQMIARAVCRLLGPPPTPP